MGPSPLSPLKLGQEKKMTMKANKILKNENIPQEIANTIYTINYVNSRAEPEPLPES